DINSRRLSGGMRRRLLIAKALVHNPPVLILDEPTAGVDVELRTQLWEYVNMLNRNGTTILLTTHYLEEAEELCDTIAVINHGELVACDKKTNLLRSFDSKQLVITPLQVLSEVPEQLKQLSATINDEGKLAIHYKPSKDSVQDILDATRNAGIAVQDVTTCEADLADIFIHLTRKAA
ncbi:MAG: ATP-binding cassette domain-containing protein, partial [Alphaproteobacteria bacterium]